MDNPQPTVAVVGASSDRHKYGNKSVRAYLAAGYKVYPIHPREAEIEGQKAYKSLADLPERVGRITLYVPPAVTRGILPEIAAAGAEEVFFNPGSADETLAAEAREMGIPAIEACSIIDIGHRPSEFGDA
jgi:predicted CoA-binding protein